ncbi:MAG: malate synthase A [Anaerolineales bacterium]|nr:malate synthase A [Anaerolineales bacterium]
MQNLPNGVQIVGPELPAFAQVLTPEALAFVAKLHRHFNPTRERLLQRRAERQLELDSGKLPDFLPNSEARGDWQVAPAPPDLQKRWVEITGPTERKMMVNALNSGASVFMADCEDALSPTWNNAVEGQLNLINAVRRQIDFVSPEGKEYKLNDQVATLLVRPRGWHLTEKNVLVDDQPISGSLFDFGLYFFHNAHELLQRGSGPYYYLPKLESHLEARLWNDVFKLAQDELSIPRGTIRATVLIETIMAAFEMEEILYELRDHMSGLNAGRWDYIFSVIKKFSRRAEFMLPDRVQVTMTVPFMRPYTELLVKTCHKHGAHAIGGMAAFIPSRRDSEVNERALTRVREDKERESSDGFDGTWVAHPDLVPVAWEIFERKLGDKPHQKERMREDVQVAASDLVNIQVPGGQITEAGIRLNVNVALQYINSWLDGNGAAAIYNLMEDTATAEISRAQLWQWLCHGAKLDDGREFTRAMYEQIRTEELASLGGAGNAHYGEAVAILDELVLNDTFIEFLTFVAYPYLS